MIRNKLKEIIEDLGFECIGNEYVGAFKCRDTGNSLTCIVKEDEDDKGVSTLRFHFFNVEGDLTEIYSLDQVISYIGKGDLTTIPPQPRNRYNCFCTVNLRIGVDMKEMSDIEYLKLMQYHSIETPADTIREYATDKIWSLIGDLSSKVDIEIGDVTCDFIRGVLE